MPTKSRSRKRKNFEPSTPESETPVSAEPANPPTGDGKNVSPFEGTISVYAGILLIVAALFPRTFKQMLLLGLGAGFLYRGQSRHCHVYSAAGINTNETGLLAQVSKKLL